MTAHAPPGEKSPGEKRKYRTLPVDEVNLYDPAQYGFREKLPAVGDTVIVLGYGGCFGSVREVYPRRRRLLVAMLEHGYRELDVGAVRPLPRRAKYKPTGRPRGRPRTRPRPLTSAEGLYQASETAAGTTAGTVAEAVYLSPRPRGRPRGRHSSAACRMTGVRLREEARERLRAACRLHGTDAATLFEALIDQWYAQGCPPIRLAAGAPPAA